VNSPLEVFAWLAALEAPDAPPERRHALTNAYNLAELAARDGSVPNDEQGFGRFVRLLAQLEADGWITWEWRRMVGDPRREPPPARLFSSLDAQSADDVRITPAGYTAYAARTQATAKASPAPAPPAAYRSTPACGLTIGTPTERRFRREAELCGGFAGGAARVVAQRRRALQAIWPEAHE